MRGHRRPRRSPSPSAWRAGVERFVYVSAYGLTERTVRLSPFAAAKRDTERLLSSSPMPLSSVIARPGAFLAVWLAAPTGIDPAKRRAGAQPVAAARARHRATSPAQFVARLARASRA